MAVATDAKSPAAPEVRTQPGTAAGMVVDLAVNSPLVTKEPSVTLHFVEDTVVGLDVNTPTAMKGLGSATTTAYHMVVTIHVHFRAAHVPHYTPLLTAGSIVRIRKKLNCCLRMDLSLI